MLGLNHRALLHKNPDLIAQHAFLHHEIAERLVTYLQENPNFTPKSIMEVGALDGKLASLCYGAYPEAAYQNFASAEENSQADLIVSNLYLQDSTDIEESVQLMKDHLNPNGKIFLSAIAYGSFDECMMVDGPEFNEYPEIKRLGDYLHGQGFMDVIMHLEKITLQYNDLKALLKDIRVVGGKLHAPLMKGLRTKNWANAWQAHMDKNKKNGIYEVTIEILYAHAQMPAMRAASMNENNEARFDLKHLRKKSLE